MLYSWNLMNANEFAAVIKSLKPDKRLLARPDLPPDYITGILSYYDLERTGNTNVNDPIIDLVTNWDLKTLDIQNVQFSDEIWDDGQFLFFGYDASPDTLAINKEKGNILAYEMISGRIMFQCAENSARFLDALCEVAKFSAERCLLKMSEEEIEVKAREVAYIAALKAGGEQYEDYYKSLLSVEE